MPRTEIINIKVQSQGAEKNVKKLGKGLDETKKQGKATGVGISGIFAAVSGGVAKAIPALNAFKGALISTGVGAIVVAVGSLVSLMSKSLGKATEFSKALSGVAAVSGASAEELAALSKSAKDLGSTTAFTAKQVVDLQTELAKLGFSTEEMLDATGATLDLAASLDVGLGEAATIAGSTLRAFGLEANQTQRIVDVLAASASKSGLDFSALTEALKNVAPVSASTNVSIEETVGLLGILADIGLKGGRAGTGLAAVFRRLNEKGITLNEALSKVNNSTNGLVTATELAGTVGGNALVALSKKSLQIDKLTESLKNAGGAAKAIAETRLDNLAGDITKLDSAWEGFLLNIEDGEGALNKLARGSIQFLTDSIGFLQKGVNVTAFVFKDGFRSIEEYIGSGVDVSVGFFNKFGASIKIFAYEAMLAISEIPLIGRAIPKELVEANLKLAEQQLDESNKRIRQGVDRYNQENLMQDTAWERYAEQQKNEALILEKKQSAKLQADLDAEITKEVNQEAKDAEEKRKKEVAKLRDKFKKAQEDLDAKDAEQKLALQRKRAIEEINQSVANAEEKKQLILEVNALYDQKEFELAKETEQKKADAIKAIQDANIEKTPLEKLEAEKTQALLSLDLLKATHEERASVIAAFDKKIQAQKDKDAQEELQREKAIQQQKLLVISDTFGAIAGILGENSKAGKAAAIAQATINTYQGITEVLTNKTTLPEPFGTIQKIASAGTVLASGLKAVRSISSQKLPSISGGRGGGGVSAAAAPTLAAPSFNIVGQGGTNQLAESIGSQEKQPIKAYVVSSDVTSAQSMERNIVQGASI